MIKDFFVNMLLLANFDAVKLFFIYVVIFFIIEIIAYNIEKILGYSTTYRWYDLVIAFVLIGMYVYNIQYLLDAIKGKL